MRDEETAFRYLTGALTGGERPDAVGRKFTPEGAPLACPGFTTICHVDKSSDAFAALTRAQERLKTGPLASAFAFMPPASLHMTIFEGIIDYSRTRARWPGHLSLDATVEARLRTRGRGCKVWTWTSRLPCVPRGFLQAFRSA